MKQSASFSGNSNEKVSLNFDELRNEGLKYVQKLSGDVWTDYNSHDPGVTILEQLCYALTDVAFRSSLSIKELLSPKNQSHISAESNAFYSPDSIFSTHPLTTLDTRKLIIDKFNEIQNVWIHTKESTAEGIRGINYLEILPKLNFLNSINSNPEEEKTFLNDLNVFLNENRNLGECYNPPQLLKPQTIKIDFKLHLKEHINIDETIANVFLSLFEFVYRPVHHSSFDEMQETYNGIEDIFAGPKMLNGFITDEIADEKLETISANELQKLFSKVDGVEKCVVNKIHSRGNEYRSIDVEPGMFFHLLDENDAVDNRFDIIYKNMEVFINDKKTTLLREHNINSLFFEIWSKRHRGYSLGNSHQDFFYDKLKGKYRNPGQYHSIQNHFPIIYGIGADGLSEHDSAERHAQANQLKAYLLLFEQHLANHLAQLENIDSIFNIKSKIVNGKTYYTQKLETVPGIDKLVKDNQNFHQSLTEPRHTFYERKNRVFNHLLARFGEDLNDFPWQIALRLNIIKSEEEMQRSILQQKSKFLSRLDVLSYSRHKGEVFVSSGKNGKQWQPSGLEEFIRIKAGLPGIQQESLRSKFFDWDTKVAQPKEEPAIDRKTFDENYRPLDSSERSEEGKEIKKGIDPEIELGNIEVKTLFRECIRFDNYRLSSPDPANKMVQVIFRKEPGVWIKLFKRKDAERAVLKIHQIVNYFIQQNKAAEGIYIVDHILLSDFLQDYKYGYRFVNEYGETLFQTLENKSWSESEEERTLKLEKFYAAAEIDESYSEEDGKIVIKDSSSEVLASFVEQPDTYFIKDFNDLKAQTQSIVKLFNAPEKEEGLLYFEEMEKIRMKGVVVEKNKEFNQRRLIYQRKIENDESIIEEDFFDMNVSIVLPDWPVRFQEESYKDYLVSLIRERIPSHIQNNICWLNSKQMKIFEEQYKGWVNNKMTQQIADTPNDALIKSATNLYKTIKDLTKR